MSADKPTLNASGAAHNAKNDRPDLLKSAQCIQARPHSSGFKSFLNWFKKVEKLQRQREDDEDGEDDSSTDASSVSSDSSTATVASFAFLEPNVYKPYGDALQPEKYIASGPYTDTYNRLILERDRRRNLDKNVTLRKKYQLYSSGLTLNGTLKPDGAKSNFTVVEDDKIKIYDTFSLPAMNKINATNLEFQNKEHRRAASETKFVRPLSYVHVKGKRRAPLPPGCTLTRTSKKKRAAPPPPIITEAEDHSTRATAPVSPISVPPLEKSPESIIPVLYHSKSEEVTKTEMSELSPRPWYKRQFSDNKGKSKKIQNEDSKTKNKTELPEIGFFRYSKIFDTKKNFNSDFSANEKRISGIHILPNISELDREANEIISMHKKFIREENNNESNPKIENLANPRSARELITKFNAMQKTNALTSQTNILLDSELIPNKKVIPPPTKLCENEMQKCEKKKVETVPAEVKTDTGNWICAKCKYQNKSFQHICSICYTRRAEPVAPTKVTDNLFKSFEAEVFDALSHLGNMSKDDTKNEHNVPSSSESKVPSSSENKASSSNEHKVPSSSENKASSSNEVKASSSSENKRPSSSEHKASSSSENKRPSSSEHKVSSSSENKGPSSSENKVPSSRDNNKNLLKNKEEEKQKLRELLKEMKNSLPKRPKSAIVTSYTSNDTEKIPVQRPADVNGPITVDVNVSTKIEPIINVKANIGVNPLYKPLVETVSSDIKIIKKTSNKTNSSAQTNDFKISTSVNSTQPVTTENLYANVGDKIAVATKKTNSDGLGNQNITDLKDPKVLLRKLETAISKGDDIAAATIARQLAILKINCTVLSSSVTKTCPNNSVNVEVYIEDQDSHHGPIQISIGKDMNIAELKQSVAKELNIPINIQRWIIGKQLAVDDTEPVSQYNKSDFSQPMFLYLVSPAKEAARAVDTKHKENPETTVEPRLDIIKPEHNKESPIKDQHLSAPSSSQVIGNNSKDVCNNQKVPAKKSADHYLELVNLDSQDLIKNMLTFECAICFLDCKAGDGVVLRECLHSFCKECLANTIRFSEEVEIKCPFRDYSYSCESVIQEREIKALVPKDAFEQHLAKSIAVAENSMQKTFHCQSADCRGWCIYEDNVNYFRCPVCRKTNCLTCQAIHEGENCKQYQERIKQNSESDLETLDGQRTKQMLEEMVNKGDAMVCPSCQVVLMKKWGCDWLRCSMCKTEICWVTRGPRWGPAGKGDTTGGCQCGVNGVKCHPKCNYCH